MLVLIKLALILFQILPYSVSQNCRSEAECEPSAPYCNLYVCSSTVYYTTTCTSNLACSAKCCFDGYCREGGYCWLCDTTLATICTTVINPCITNSDCYSKCCSASKLCTKPSQCQLSAGALSNTGTDCLSKCAINHICTSTMEACNTYTLIDQEIRKNLTYEFMGAVVLSIGVMGFGYLIYYVCSRRQEYLIAKRKLARAGQI